MLSPQGLDLVAGGGEDGAEAGRDVRVGVFYKDPYLRQHLLDPLGDDEAQLPEQAAQGVDLGGPG